jgi:kynurenine formamidase
MARTLIDISVPPGNDIPADSPPKIIYQNHQQTVPEFLEFFPGLTKNDLPDGEAAAEKIELSTHNGTHPDAPYHLASTLNKGTSTTTPSRQLQFAIKVIW